MTGDIDINAYNISITLQHIIFLKNCINESYLFKCSLFKNKAVQMQPDIFEPQEYLGINISVMRASMFTIQLDLSLKHVCPFP